MRRPRFSLSIRYTFVLLFTCALFITVWIGGFLGRSASVAQATDVSELVQTGVDRYQSGNFVEAIAPWRSAYEVYNTTQELPALAVVSENLARAYQQMGQTSEEIVYWERAIASTQTLGNRPKLGRLLTEQAQAYSRLGQQRRAIAILCGSETDICEASSALQIAETAEDKTAQVAALGSLGEAYRLSGDAEKALTYLDRGHTIARELGDPILESAILNSLGNTAASLAQVNYRRASEAETRGDREATRPLQAKATEFNGQAIEHFQQSYELALTQQDASAQVRSLLSLIPAHERADRLDEAQRYRALALTALNQLPDSQMKAFAAIQLADFLEPLNIRQSQILLNASLPAAESDAIALLNQALAIGEAIENPRVTSFAMGKLGNLDERSGRYAEALKKTQEARLAADQNLAARDSLYLWEWQLARILKAQDNLPASAQAYSQSIALLEQIRSDILNANRDLQFDFRDTVEPIYRQYAELNLKEVPDAVALTTGEKAFTQLDTALTTLDSLKVAELQSYFANDCVIVPTATRVDAVGDSAATAVFSTAILGNSSQESSPTDASSNHQQLAAQSTLQELAVIVSFPDGSKKISQISVPQTEIEAQINRFRNTLESGRSQYINEYDFAPSQQLYQWLIAPFEKDLNNIDTLVFVNDGLLRSVPMAALYDGKQFLIEKFAVATTPSLTLTAPEKIERPTELSALLMGVSEQPKVPGRSFAALQAVDKELASVAAQFPNSKTLLNQAFSVEALRATLTEKDYRILHMATHGTFGFDPADNFVVAGAKQMGEAGEFNETLTISELDELIRSVSDPTRESIELLTLTACETAIGDNRSTLGLAGVAIRAGVRSAIATLWSVSDDSSAELISQFYENLKNPDLTKAQAMQKAQIAMLTPRGLDDDFVRRHPYRWAPFILIGNWL
jgi:CHAT domain-containing protein/tetratricopeptide (TPR) repeat protein